MIQRFQIRSVIGCQRSCYRHARAVTGIVVREPSGLPRRSSGYSSGVNRRDIRTTQRSYSSCPSENEPHDSASRIIELDRRHVWHPYAATPASVPCVPVERAEGVRLHLASSSSSSLSSSSLIDGMSSWWACVHGYSHPRLVSAGMEQLKTMSHVMFGGLTHEPAVNLAEGLVHMVDEALYKHKNGTGQRSSDDHLLPHLFFCDSGSVAIEVAMKMALQYWVIGSECTSSPPPSKFLTVRGGYHGDTFRAMSVCDPVNGMHHELFGHVLKPPQIFSNRPISRFPGSRIGYRNLNAEETQETVVNDVRHFASMLESHQDDIAAVILEPIVQGAGGMHMYHPDFLVAVRDLCDEYDILMIADEIATGFGRTGELLACGHAKGKVVPDILCLGKALSGGMLSLAATMTTATVAERLSSDGNVLMHGPTFMGNPLACAIGCASLDLLLDEQYAWRDRVRSIERQLTAELAPCRDSPLVRDVRVLGAIGVVELEDPVDMTKLQPAIVERGVWLRPFGRLLYTMPPFIIEPEDLSKITSVMMDIGVNGYGIR